MSAAYTEIPFLFEFYVNFYGKINAHCKLVKNCNNIEDTFTDYSNIAILSIFRMLLTYKLIQLENIYGLYK